MGRPLKYPNPPIQEAVCEIRFVQTNSTPAQTEQIQKLWASYYPKQQFVEENRLQLHINVDGVAANTMPIGQKLIAKSDDELKWVQLSNTSVAVNRLRPYIGWEEEFRDTILRRFGEAKAIFDIQTLHQIGLRYINRIDIPESPISWKHWFTVGPSAPDSIAARGGMLQSHFRQMLDKNRECIVNFGLLPSKEGATTVLLDIDVVQRGEFKAANANALLDEVHAPHRDIFEGYLLDNTRNLFQL